MYRCMFECFVLVLWLICSVNVYSSEAELFVLSANTKQEYRELRRLDLDQRRRQFCSHGLRLNYISDSCLEVLSSSEGYEHCRSLVMNYQDIHLVLQFLSRTKKPNCRKAIIQWAHKLNYINTHKESG